MKTSALYSQPIVKTLVYSNVFIALCAMAQVFLTYHVFPIPVNYENNTYLLFVFLSTYLQYNVQRGYMVNQSNLFSDRSQWLTKHKKTMMLSVAISLIAVMFLCNNLSWTSIGIMIGAELLSTLYYLPPFNIRKYGYIKPFLISLIWTLSCVAVPLIENDLVSTIGIYFVISQFFFISLLCLLFDIKDNANDFLQGVNTYANNFGVNFTKGLGIVLVILQGVFCYLMLPAISIVLSTIIISLLSIITIMVCNDNRHNFFYYLWVDGLLIIQAGLFFWLA